MIILGIETSCDETAAAVIKKSPTDTTAHILSNVVASSLPLHAKTGGIIPETAAREQIKYIIPVISQALRDASQTLDTIDAIAVTIGPGLIGPLLVGVETAKTLAYTYKKPIIPVNHLFGHIYANWLENDQEIVFPAIALIVSGGHTDLLLFKSHQNITWLGGTRDDAAGEAFDKIGRLLGMAYPAGASIENAAKSGDAKRFSFPRPMLQDATFEFSFSGLKTAVLRTIQTIEQLNNETISNISASAQQAVVDVLITKIIKAAIKYKVKSILLGGGVVANESLRAQFIQNTKYQIPNTEIFFPKKFLCTDNAAMIATAAFFMHKPIQWQKITADPQLYFTEHTSI